MSNEVIHVFAQGLLRDSMAEYASRPGVADDPGTTDLVGHLRRELEGCGYEFVHGQLVPRQAALPAEARQRTLFDELLEVADLPHHEEVRGYFAAAEFDLHRTDLKGVGQNVRLATDRVLEDIVALARKKRGGEDPGRGWTAMVDWLQSHGTLGPRDRDRQDAAEAAFLKGYYRFVSVEGSHTGIPERYDAETVLRLGYFVAVHLLEKLVDWKARDFADYTLS